MHPAILIIEPRREVADALFDVVTSANYTPMVRAYLEHLSDLPVMPAAIVLRIAREGVGEPPHACLAHLAGARPPVVAIAWEEEDVREAHRLGCEVVLRAPDDVGRLCQALAHVIQGVA